MGIKNSYYKDVCEIIPVLSQAGDTKTALSLLTAAACSLIPSDHGAALFTLKNGYPFCIRWPEYAEQHIHDFNTYFNRRIPVFSAPDEISLGPVKWRRYSDTEYVTDFNAPLGIRHSVGAQFNDSFTGNIYILWIHRNGKTASYSGSEAAALRLLCRQASCFISLRSELDTVGRDLIKDPELDISADILSRREIEVAKLICRRLSMREIAEVLRISQRTVETHVLHIYNKLGVANKKELTRLLLNSLQE